MRIARFVISPEFLRQALSLPLGTQIVSAGMDWRDVELIIEHPDLRDVVPLAEAERPPLIRPRFRREADVVLLEDWGQT